MDQNWAFIFHDHQFYLGAIFILRKNIGVAMVGKLLI